MARQENHIHRESSIRCDLKEVKMADHSGGGEGQGPQKKLRMPKLTTNLGSHTLNPSHTRPRV
jgi:hypothetical protein